MKEELENKLIKRFPHFYKPNPYGCNFLRFEFECMDGFFNLIWKTSEDIEKALKKYPLIYSESFSIAQVKTKFRELRIYYIFDRNIVDRLDIDTLNLIDSELIEIIGKASALSKSLCEVCGKTVTDKNIDASNNWIIKCTDCAKKEKDEKQGSKI